ncbi:MAG: heparinase, partial [Candidatus Hydrogenedentes bacterium]|nr:heparinase [Candidatus Hydrogenedentota bacterium]
MFTGLVVVMETLSVLSAPRIATVEEVCEAYPARIDGLLEALDLERPGLEKAKAAADAGDRAAACQALLAYYRDGDTAAWLRQPLPEPGEGRDAAADAVLDGVFTNYRITAKVPTRPDGGLDWAYNGPDGDKEWGWGLNRHPWAGTLLRAYRTTGNPIYLDELDRLIQDWILVNPYPGKRNSTPQWRGLEVRSRAGGQWLPIFFGLQQADGFTPATRLLMLSSVPDHAHYARHFHARGGNWITMEMNGLASIAAAWPEFREAGAWADYAAERLLPEMAAQVYPDGVQMELTSHYHRVALHSFEQFATILARAGY